MNNYEISVEKLTNGEFVGLSIIEITSIPHLSIIDENRDPQEIIQQYKVDFADVLSEIYQLYKSSSISGGYNKDISVELLWKTTKVENQPYNAGIRLFVIVRSIDNNEKTVVTTVENAMNIFVASLELDKYEFVNISYQNISEIIEEIDDSTIKGIVKEEKIENLQNQILPYCYTFDKLPLSNNDFSRIVNAVTEYPDIALSFQLLPMVYAVEETSELDKITQALDTLSKGVMDQGVGNVSFTLAEKHAQMYRYYSENKTAPLFLFNILVYGNERAIANISSRLFGQLSSGIDSNASLKFVDFSADEINKSNNFYPLPWAVNEVLINKDRNLNIWNSGSFSNALYRLPYIITAEEASEFFRLPIGSDKVSAGLIVNESGKDKKTYNSNIINGGDITVGKLRSSSKGDTIGFSLKDLAKHMLVVGTPGSGKTTFSVSLLDRLWKEHNIPFLVIEPAKNEYRALVQSIPELQVFTPGKNFISPFVFNPFIPPKKC